uniref:hypothetical protein n=1 Tax=Salmonella enterica TaxID=28901 RepID=UPI00329872CE
IKAVGSNHHMATAVSTVGAVKLNGAGVGCTVPSSPFLGTTLKKVNSRANNYPKVSSFKVVAGVEETKESKQTDKDRWKGLAFDIPD